MGVYRCVRTFYNNNTLRSLALLLSYDNGQRNRVSSGENVLRHFYT